MDMEILKGLRVYLQGLECQYFYEYLLCPEEHWTHSPSFPPRELSPSNHASSIYSKEGEKGKNARK